MNKNKSTALDAINTELLFRQSPIAVAVSIVAAMLYVMVIWQESLGSTVVLWFAITVALLLLRALIVWQYLRQDMASIDHQRWRRFFVVVAAASAFCWGLIPYLFKFDTSVAHQMLGITIMTGMVAGGLSTMSSVPGCYRLYVLSMLMPFLAGMLRGAEDADLVLAFLGAIFAAVMLRHSHSIYNTLVRDQKSRQDEEYKNRVMEMIAKDMPLPRVLQEIVLSVEAQAQGMLCSILLLDFERKHIVLGAAPNIPDFFSRAIEGKPIGPAAGSCGTAMYTAQRVIVEDISSHLFWDDYREVALNAGLMSCWSEPIKSADGSVLGAFAIYHRVPSSPNAESIHRIELAAQLASIAIERKTLQEDH